jgi:hypothetical protein
MFLQIKKNVMIFLFLNKNVKLKLGKIRNKKINKNRNKLGCIYLKFRMDIKID